MQVWPPHFKLAQRSAGVSGAAIGYRTFRMAHQGAAGDHSITRGTR